MEKVNHPAHYNIPGKKECIEQMLYEYGKTVTATFCLTNAFKYLYRAGIKEGESQKDDISKAQWYFNYANERCDIEKIMTVILECLYHDVEEELKRYENN